MNHSLESIQAFFVFNKKPYWKVENIQTKSLVVSNDDIENLDAAWEYFVTAYNSFIWNGSYKFVVKNNINTADNKSPSLVFNKGQNNMTGIGTTGNMTEQMMMMQMFYPHLSGMAQNSNDKLERLQEENKRLTQELTEAKFSNQIEMLKRDNKDKKKTGIGEALVPLLNQHLPSILAFAGGNMAPRAAVGVADVEDKTVIDSIVNNNNTESGESQKFEIQKANILEQPGFHSIDHAVKILDTMEELLPEYNINAVLQNLVFAIQKNPEQMKMMIQNYI